MSYFTMSIMILMSQFLNFNTCIYNFCCTIMVDYHIKGGDVVNRLDKNEKTSVVLEKMNIQRS